MDWIRKHRPSPATGIALAALVVALGGAAFAAIPDSNGTIHGCVQRSNGNLRIVESSTDCRTNENAIAWEQGQPGSLGSDARFFSSNPGTFLFGELVTIYDVPGLLKVQMKCEERPDQVLGTDLKTVTFVIDNEQPGDSLRLLFGPFAGGETTLAPGSSTTVSAPQEVTTPEVNRPNLDMLAFGGEGRAAQGKGPLRVQTSSCSAATQTLSNVAGP